MKNTDTERVALVFGIPVSPEEFKSRRESAAGWDYGDQLGAARENLKESFTNSYETVCRVAAELIRRASDLDLTVRFGACIDHLRDVFEAHDSVVLFAHWRGSNISEADLLPGWQDVVQELLDDSAAPLSIVLRESNQGQALVQRHVLVRTLNVAIERGRFRPFLPSGLDERVSVHKLVFEALSRDLIDAAFRGLLRRGNLLELFDGLHTPAAFAAAIPTQFSGVLDLSCCTSSVLATFLRLDRGDTINIIGGDETLIPAPQMRLIECALNLLSSQRDAGYWHARLECAKGLGDWRDQRHSQTTP